MKPEDEPYALSSLAEQLRRITLLNQSYIAPLAKYLADIKAEHAEKDLLSCGVSLDEGRK